MMRIAVIGLVGESVFLRVSRHQAVGETAHASDIHREWGGKGYNQAVAAARYGAEVAFLGAAHSADADRIIDAALADGVKATVIKKDTPTAYGVIVTDDTGDNRVTVYGGAALCASDVELFKQEIEAADVLLLNNEVPEEVNLAASRLAAAQGVRIIINPAPARELSPELISLAELLTPNEHEAGALPKSDKLLITLAGEGSLITKTGERIPAYNSGEVVDTTGAGDTFSGVLAAALSEGRSLDSAARIASAAASIEVTRRFVMPAIPTREEIESMMIYTAEP
ncbi:MAG: hypothetical protein IKC32_03445 [Clostridia bacterium]|nr:hypothetical protein [Clostridia bacterium]